MKQGPIQPHNNTQNQGTNQMRDNFQQSLPNFFNHHHQVLQNQNIHNNQHLQNNPAINQQHKGGLHAQNGHNP